MIKRQGNVVLDAFNMILQIISQLLVVRFTDLNITLINKNKITPTFSSTIWPYMNKGYFLSSTNV